MGLLSRREHSFVELCQKLSLRFVDQEQDVRDAVERLRAQGLQSDSRFIESFIRNKVSRGYGWSKIENEFYFHEVDQNLINDVLSELNINWFELTQQAFEKKSANVEIIDYKQVQKIKSFLHRKGFFIEDINKIVSLTN